MSGSKCSLILCTPHLREARLAMNGYLPVSHAELYPIDRAEKPASSAHDAESWPVRKRMLSYVLPAASTEPHPNDKSAKFFVPARGAENQLPQKTNAHPFCPFAYYNINRKNAKIFHDYICPAIPIFMPNHGGMGACPHVYLSPLTLPAGRTRHICPPKTSHLAILFFVGVWGLAPMFTYCP